MNQPVAQLDGHGGAVLRLVLDADRGLGYSADATGLVRAWRFVATGSEPATTELWRVSEASAVHALLPAKSGNTDVLITAGAYPRLSVYAREDGRERTHITLAGDDVQRGGSVRDLAGLPRQERVGKVVAAMQHGLLVAYDLSTGARILSQSCGLGSAQSCDMRAEGESGAALVAVGDTTGRIALLQQTAAGLTAIATHEVARDAVIYGTTLLDSDAQTGPALVALSSSGALLYQGGADERPRPIAQAKQQHQQYALAVSAQGRYAFVGGESREIAVFRLAQGERVATLATHGHAVWSLAATDESLFAGDANGNVLRYDLTSVLPA